MIPRGEIRGLPSNTLPNEPLPMHLPIVTLSTPMLNELELTVMSPARRMTVSQLTLTLMRYCLMDCYHLIATSWKQFFPCRQYLAFV
jgi:hypothetical protein